MIRFYLFVVSVLFFIPSFSQVIDTTVLYEMEKLSNKVNSSYHEGAPVVTPDGNTLYFFRTNHPQNRYGKDETQDIWFSVKGKDGEWGPAYHADNNLNRNKSNQIVSVVNKGRTLVLDGGKGKNDRGLSISSWEGGEWSKPEAVEIEGYEKMNIGKFSGGCMSDDMKYLILYFSEKSGQTFSDLYLSKQISSMHYSKPVKMPLSTPKDEFGPFLSQDETKMYYASGMDGGYGSLDVYQTERLDDSWMKWSTPVNLGPPVNTKGFDAYFSVDGSWENAFTTRAYMSLDGGSLDIMSLKPKPEVTLKGKVMDIYTHEPLQAFIEIEVLKIGKLPTKSKLDGTYKTLIRERGTYVFFAHSEGYEDYYDTLELPNPARKELIEKNLMLTPKRPEVEISGTVYDNKTSEKLGDVRIGFKTRFYDTLITQTGTSGYYQTKLPNTGKYIVTLSKEGYYNDSEFIEIKEEKGKSYYTVKHDFYLDPEKRPIILKGTVSNQKTGKHMHVDMHYRSLSGRTGDFNSHNNGHYKIKLPESGTYQIIANAEGFLTYKDTVTVHVPYHDHEFEKNVEMVPIEVGATVRLNEIYFDFDKAELRPESYPELGRVVEFMQLNSTLTIEISGHTDDRGSDEYNEKLSQERSDAVRTYILSKGIKANRIVAKGYGESKPLVANDSDENRQFNRRVQFTILKK